MGWPIVMEILAPRRGSGRGQVLSSGMIWSNPWVLSRPARLRSKGDAPLIHMGMTSGMTSESITIRLLCLSEARTCTLTRPT